MPKIKRESRSFIVINEEKLILEVQKRPILYDKALKGYRKPVTRENAWQEVSELLQSPVEECKKRWRSLRDAFMKQYKLFQRGDTSIKKRWLFYEQMEFLAPYFDAEGINIKYDIDTDYIVERDTDGIPTKLTTKSFNHPTHHILCLNEADGTDYHSEEIEIGEYDVLDEEEEENDTTALVTAPIRSEPNRSQTSVTAATEEPQYSAPQSKPSSSSSYHSNDPDERFLLSCLPIFHRLSNKKNALARLKIQQLLFHIEFSDDNS